MKIYKNKAQISRDLKKFKLQRDISIEELKIIKNHFKDEFTVNSWFKPVIKTLSKIGLYNFSKRLIN